MVAWFVEHGMSQHTALAWDAGLRDIFPFTSTELKHFAVSAKKAVKDCASGGKGRRYSALPEPDTKRAFPQGTLVPSGTQGTPSEKKLPVLFPALAEAVRQTPLKEEKKRKARTRRKQKKKTQRKKKGMNQKARRKMQKEKTTGKKEKPNKKSDVSEIS